jgi:hypothetical protein
MVKAVSSATLGADMRCVETVRFSKEIIMRILVTALLTLSVLAGIAAPASAFDARSFFDQLDREKGGSSGG